MAEDGLRVDVALLRGMVGCRVNQIRSVYICTYVRRCHLSRTNLNNLDRANGEAKIFGILHERFCIGGTVRAWYSI